jgi:hypothetical protein
LFLVKKFLILTWSEVTTVATPAVNFTGGRVVQVGRIQRFVAIETGEAPFVPYFAFADHLFGSIDGETTTWATMAVGGLGTLEGHTFAATVNARKK